MSTSPRVNKNTVGQSAHELLVITNAYMSTSAASVPTRANATLVIRVTVIHASSSNLTSSQPTHAAWSGLRQLPSHSEIVAAWGKAISIFCLGKFSLIGSCCISIAVHGIFINPANR